MNVIVGLLLVFSLFSTITIGQNINQSSIPSGTGQLVVQNLAPYDGGKKLLITNDKTYFATNYGKIVEIEILNKTGTSVVLNEIVDFNESIHSSSFHAITDSLIIHNYSDETLIYELSTGIIHRLSGEKWFTTNAVITETTNNISVFNKQLSSTTVIPKTIFGAIVNEIKEVDNTLWISYTFNGSDGLVEYDLLSDTWLTEGNYIGVY